MRKEIWQHVNFPEYSAGLKVSYGPGEWFHINSPYFKSCCVARVLATVVKMALRTSTFFGSVRHLCPADL